MAGISARLATGKPGETDRGRTVAGAPSRRKWTAGPGAAKFAPATSAELRARPKNSRAGLISKCRGVARRLERRRGHGDRRERGFGVAGGGFWERVSAVGWAIAVEGRGRETWEQ